MVSKNGAVSVRFGMFELDLRAGELRRNGSKIRLQEQPFKVLTLLVERPGEVVTREQLQRALWPADTFVDFDHSLNAAIRRLRDALGDSAENPRFVETVARRGYRFLAPVNGAHINIEALALSPTAAKSKHWAIIVPAAMLIVGLLAGLAIAYWPRTSNRVKDMQVEQRRLTANPENDPVTGAVISPDGKYLAFSDSTGFYLREIDTGETHALTLPRGFSAVPVAWYQDGHHLIAGRAVAPYSEVSLWEVSTLGGPPRKLTDNGRSPRISPDGSQIAFVRGQYMQNEIWLMGTDGGNPKPLISGQKQQCGQPEWSPDGSKIVFTASTYHAELFKMGTSIQVYDLKKTSQETLLSAEVARQGTSANTSGGPPDVTAQFGHEVLWTTDNQLIYSISEPIPNQADFNIWSVPLDRDGHISGRSSRLSATPDEVSNLSASKDGKRIAVTKDSQNPDIYITELDSADTALKPLRQFTFDLRVDLPFSWTPDSKAVLFSSDRDGVFHVFKQQIDQTVPELLVGGNEQAVGPRLAPDNDSVIYVNWPRIGEPATHGGIMRVPLSGGPPQMVLKHNAVANLQCARSPATLCLFDSRTPNDISFYSFDPKTGKNQELPELKIHDPSAYAYNWNLSPDGKLLALCNLATMPGKSPYITFIGLETGSRHVVEVPSWTSVTALDFAADSQSVWAPAVNNAGKWALLNITEQGQIKTMLTDDTMEIGWAIAAPDGKHLAIWKGRQSSNVWMLQRF